MEALLEIYEIYIKCKNILKKESENDTETAPSHAQLKAKDLLQRAKTLIDEQMKLIDSSSEHLHMYKAMAANLTALVAENHVKMEEFSKAEELYMECLASVSDPLDPFCIGVSVNARNELGVLWYHRSQFAEAKKWLEEAEELYLKFRKQGGVAKNCFHAIENEPEEESEKVLEIFHTMTKFYLAQVYQALKDPVKSAVYCHETLKREFISKIQEPIDWALYSATLSQVFMEKGSLKQARHHLAAASYVLDTYEEKLKDVELPEEETEAKRENFRHRSADVSRCWAKYGIFLLELSKDHPEKEKLSHKDFDNLWFDELDLSSYENQIVDSVVVAFEDAREVFLFTQKHLNKAKEYYTLEDRASDHVNIVQDHSLLFRLLSEFEPDEERQLKMMRKRTNMLEVVVKELNPKYYWDLCWQIWFELGETYHNMMQIRLQKVINSSEVPSPQALLKINSLAETSATNFNYFLDSIKDKKTKELPDPLPEEVTEATLFAHFYLGRLYHKYITQDPRKQIENTKKAYDCFKYVVDTCEKSEKARSSVSEALNTSKEMMTLLQMKILQL